MFGLTVNPVVGVGEMIQTVALLVAAAAFVREGRRHSKTEREAQEARKIEIYQRLEIESNRVFEFEARHPQLVPMMKRRLAPHGSIGDLKVHDEYNEPMNARQIAMIARKYYEMNCNLFEIAARLRKLDLIEPEVFGSWVAWYFDTCTEWGFRALWAHLRDNYTSDLRAIFDPLCGTLIERWDIPHAEGRLKGETDEDGLPDVTSEELEARRAEFYAQIGVKFDCATIAAWMTEVSRSPLPAPHPLSYS